MAAQPPASFTLSTPSRNLAAIDAADLGIDFIDRCVLPLTRAMRHLPDSHPDLGALNDLLSLQAGEYRDLFTIIRAREDG